MIDSNLTFDPVSKYKQELQADLPALLLAIVEQQDLTKAEIIQQASSQLATATVTQADFIASQLFTELVESTLALLLVRQSIYKTCSDKDDTFGQATYYFNKVSAKINTLAGVPIEELTILCLVQLHADANMLCTRPQLINLAAKLLSRISKGTCYKYLNNLLEAGLVLIERNQQGTAKINGSLRLGKSPADALSYFKHIAIDNFLLLKQLAETELSIYLDAYAETATAQPLLIEQVAEIVQADLSEKARLIQAFSELEIVQQQLAAAHLQIEKQQQELDSFINPNEELHLFMEGVEVIYQLEVNYPHLITVSANWCYNKAEEKLEQLSIKHDQYLEEQQSSQLYAAVSARIAEDLALMSWLDLQATVVKPSQIKYYLRSAKA
jgi:DNA-binding PadR family transcriptional regulator